MNQKDLEIDGQGFLLRGKEMTRLEAFTDAAFAFSLTLLVISFDALPQSFDEFIVALKNVPVFAASFAQISMFWYAHHIWSRRFGLDDFRTALLTLAFVFVTLIYVYPLKIIFAALFTWLTDGFIPFTFDQISVDNLRSMFIIYGLGFVGMSGLITAHYLHARGAVTDLSETEHKAIRIELGSWALVTLIGGIQVILAMTIPNPYAPFSGMTYGTLAIIMPIYHALVRRKDT